MCLISDNTVHNKYILRLENNVNTSWESGLGTATPISSPKTTQPKKYT